MSVILNVECVRREIELVVKLELLELVFVKIYVLNVVEASATHTRGRAAVAVGVRTV